MKGYVYITGAGADPGDGEPLSDPVFKGTPSLGACMPNIRRAVFPGDWIFVVSAKRPAVQQYVVGGMQVKEKLDAMAAYNRVIDVIARNSKLTEAQVDDLVSWLRGIKEIAARP